VPGVSTIQTETIVYPVASFSPVKSRIRRRFGLSILPPILSPILSPVSSPSRIPSVRIPSLVIRSRRVIIIRLRILFSESSVPVSFYRGLDVVSIQSMPEATSVSQKVVDVRVFFILDNEKRLKRLD
jgi:hypothetical protein